MISSQFSPKTKNRNFITMCAGCGSVKIAAGWLPYSWARFLIDIPKMKHEMRISHGICKNCAVKMYGPAITHIFENK